MIDIKNNIDKINILQNKYIKILIKLIFTIVFTSFIIFVGMSSLLYLEQDSMIFYPQPINKINLEHIQTLENISLTTQDEFRINGWLVKSTKTIKMPLVLYFGGNAEEVSNLINDSEKFNDWNIGLINYRGYGLSEGKPSERALFKDALQIYDYFYKRQDIDTTKIVLMGRSLGSCVATYVAQNRSVNGVILVTPYDSMLNLAKNRFPIIPMNIILNHKFDSISRAASIKLPLLALAASNDQTIPPIHAKHLVEKWGGKVTFKIIEGENHNSISKNSLYWKYIQQFLAEIR